MEPIAWRTVKQVAERVQCSPDTIYNEVRAGRLRAARIGGRREIRIRDEWVDAWLEQSATQPGADRRFPRVAG